MENIQNNNLSENNINKNMEIPLENNLEPGEQVNSWGNNGSHSNSNSRSISRSSSHSSRRNSFNSNTNLPNRRSNDVSYNPNLPNIKQKDPNEKPPILDFLIFLSNSFKKIILDKNILWQIESQFEGVHLTFDDSKQIPEYPASLLKISGNSLKAKRDASQKLLEQLNNIKLENETKKNRDIIQILIMIPNGLVSMVIGTKGKQITNLIRESKAQIVINQPIYKMTYRTVSIQGKPENIANAIMYIQEIMETRYNEVNKIEFECKPLNITTTQTNVKLIIDYNIVDRISGKRHDNFINYLEDKYNVNTTIYQDRKNRQLDRKDYICSLKGTIKHVQNAIMDLIMKIKNDIRQVYDQKDSFTLRMLINKVFVTKLIGAGGCMIQEIANFAKGASIKIMSNKFDEKKNSCFEIPVSVAGGFNSILDATCIIIEQMECFKNGGPVLKDGKSLHQNIANQFVNSIFTTANNEEDEDKYIYTLKDHFNNSIKDSETDNLKNNEEKIVDINENNQSNIGKHNSYYNYNNDNEKNIKKKEYSRSRSISSSRNYSSSHSRRSHSRSRSRSRSRSYDNNRNHRRYDNDYRYEKNEKNYYSNNNIFSYEENGIIKINTYFLVPDNLVSFLIGKKGENVKNIMNKTGSIITFSKEYIDDSKINTSNGTGRLCNLKGTSDQNSKAMKMILDLIIEYEREPYGIKKEK